MHIDQYLLFIGKVGIAGPDEKHDLWYPEGYLEAREHGYYKDWAAMATALASLAKDGQEHAPRLELTDETEIALFLAQADALYNGEIMNAILKITGKPVAIRQTEYEERRHQPEYDQLCFRIDGEQRSVRLYGFNATNLDKGYPYPDNFWRLDLHLYKTPEESGEFNVAYWGSAAKRDKMPSCIGALNFYGTTDADARKIFEPLPQAVTYKGKIFVKER